MSTFQDYPPIYDVTKVTVPVYLFSGDLDILADPDDVAWLANQLPNIKGTRRFIHSTLFNSIFPVPQYLQVNVNSRNSTIWTSYGANTRRNKCIRISSTSFATARPYNATYPPLQPDLWEY
jgi:hypothetical protein